METKLDAIVAELARIETKLDHILDQVRRINGRVAGLENWRHTQELEAARAAGRSEALITKRHLLILAGAVPAISTIIGMLSRYVW